MAQRTLLAAAVRAATNATEDVIRSKEKGLHLIINMTAVPGVDTVTFTVQGKAADGSYYTLLASSAIVATGTTVLRIRPGCIAAANSVANDSLPDVYRVNCVHSAGTNFNYNLQLNTLD